MLNAIHRSVPVAKERGAVIAAVLVLGALLDGCSKAPPVVAPPPEVRVAAVVQRDVPIHSEWIGTTQGNIDAQIRARVQGYLLSRDYTEGGVVKEGDVLFVIDARPYEAALAQARGELGRAEALLTKADQDVARYRPLAAEGAVSRQELDNAVQASRAGNANVASARATVQQAELDLAWTKVQAPITGIAGIAKAQVGDLIESNTLLTTMSQLDPVKVQFPLSEPEYLGLATRLATVGQGTEVPKDTLELVLADGSTYPHRGSFTFANREVDVKTGAILVQGIFPNPGNLLRPGLYARVRAVTETRKGALLVPQRAVRELQGGHQVAVVGADDTVDLRSVEVGERVDSLWVINRGLQPGERVVVEGLQKIRQGAKVTIKAAEAGAAGSDPGATAPGSHG